MSTTPRSPRARRPSQNNAIVAEAVMDKAIGRAPSPLQPYLKKIEPIILVAIKIFDTVDPYIAKAWKFCDVYGHKFYAFIEPYDPQYLMPMVIGMLMMLFGGNFMLLIACIEGYRICGWETTWSCLQELWASYKAVKKADDEDNARDDDHDGVADVLEISETDLITRKTLLFMRSADPLKISACLGGIYQGWVAVAAVLRLEFARTVALGVALGEVIANPLMKLLHPVFIKLVAPEYEKWVEVVIRYICKCIGLWVAVTLARIISAVHSALRGARMFTDGFAEYTRRRGYTKLSEGYWDDIFAGCVGVFGVYMQLETNFTLPWLLKLPLLPFVMAENFLFYWLAYDAK